MEEEAGVFHLQREAKNYFKLYIHEKEKEGKGKSAVLISKSVSVATRRRSLIMW